MKSRDKILAQLAQQQTTDGPVKSSAPKREILSLILWVVAALFVGFIVFFIYPSINVFHISRITNVKKYPKIIATVAGSPIFAHFPNPIPPDASDIRFYCEDALGSSKMQLRYTTTPAEIERLYKVFVAKKLTAFEGGSYNDPPDANFLYVDDACVKTSQGIQPAQYSADYTIIILRDEQNDTAGVAINKKQNTIVYWASRWSH